MEQDREEGEMSDDNEMLVDEQEPPLDSPTKSTVVFIADKNGLFVQQLEKVDACRLEERAKRFGLNLTGNKIVTQKQIDKLYSNFGIESGNERHFRFDTLHLNGVNGLTTKDIFVYLEDYKPVSLEWVDHNSCNIVCQDHISAALALLVHSREIKSEDVKDMLLHKSSHYWREGMPHPRRDTILMRFATNSDKKKSTKALEKTLGEAFDDPMHKESKNPWGDLCKSWGIYDHQEVFQRQLPKTDYEEDSHEPFEKVQIKNKKLALRLGKRNYNVENNESSDSDCEWKKKSKTPRMRMHADDEESKQKTQNHIKQTTDEEEDYAPLSIEIINSRSKFAARQTKKISEKFRHIEKNTNTSHRNVHSRLGIKVAAEERRYSDESSSNESDHNIMSRVQKVVTGSKNTSNVWSRLEIKPKSSEQKDLRQMLKTRKPKSDDLRDRLGKSKQCNLRIEIDNSYANK